MSTPIRIKRSAVPGKRPQVTDLQVGELALNTYDAELVTLRDRFAQTGIATEVVRVGAGATVTNIIYVTKDGNDDNTGLKLGDAKATIKSAVGIASTGDIIKVSAGSYIENNPVKLPSQVNRFLDKFVDSMKGANLNRMKRAAILYKVIDASGMTPQQLMADIQKIKKELK